jgi:hypothetical protein
MGSLPPNPSYPASNQIGCLLSLKNNQFEYVLVETKATIQLKRMVYLAYAKANQYFVNSLLVLLCKDIKRLIVEFLKDIRKVD